MATAMSSSSMIDRMVRASRLDIHAYEEVEADLNATTQALWVVVIVAVASGIGAAIAVSMGTETGGTLIGTLISAVLSEIIGWAVWSWIMYFVGTRFFNATATYGEVLRTIGFSTAPGVLEILRFVPVIGGIITVVVGIWRLVTAFVAVRQSLDISNGATVATIIVGFIGFIVVSVLLGLLLGIFGLGAAGVMGLL